MFRKVILALSLGATLLASSPFRPLPPDGAQPERAAGQGGGKIGGRVAEKRSGRVGLPYAFGHSFETLDEYLLHLQRHAGPIDLPWWRKAGPDRFELVRRMPGAAPQVATRAELLERYGFAR